MKSKRIPALIDMIEVGDVCEIKAANQRPEIDRQFTSLTAVEHGIGEALIKGGNTMPPKHAAVNFESTKPARLHLVHRTKARVHIKDAEPLLSNTPLSDPAEILRQMPTQAKSPALLELLDLMSSPILLITQSPAGELREVAPPKLVRAAA